MVECEEPRCSREATREWEGKRVCDDHYDSYREELDKIRRDLSD